MFLLDTQLASDSIVLGDFTLTRMLLSKNANYPWFILVPKRNGLRELFELSEDDHQQFCWESNYFSKKIYTLFKADKLNIAALGNKVPQLHVHHIVRYKTDAAWPAPVWGQVTASAYQPAEIEEIKQKLQAVLLQQFIIAQPTS